MSDDERGDDHDDEGDFDEDEDQDDIEVLSDNDEQDEGAAGNFKNKRGHKKNVDRITAKFLTKYERARILGTRALQLSKNAPPMVVPQPGETDPYQLAERELAQRKIPFIIRRFLPDHTYEDWKLSELTYD